MFGLNSGAGKILKPGRQCHNCNKPLEKSTSFASKMRRTSFPETEDPDTIPTVGQALVYIISQINPTAEIAPINENYYERRALCRQCTGKLTSLYVAYTRFFESTGTNSYIYNRIQIPEDRKPTTQPVIRPENPEVAEEVEIKPEPKQLPRGSRSVKQDLDKIYVSRNKVAVLKNWNTRKIRSEIENLCKLGNAELYPQSPAQSGPICWKSLDKQLSRIAPYTRAILLAFGSTTGKKAELTPKIGTALYILLNSFNCQVSTFQKTISSTLEQLAKSRKKVYNQLNKLGMCSSYHSMLRDVEREPYGVSASTPAIGSATRKRLGNPTPDAHNFNQPKRARNEQGNTSSNSRRKRTLQSLKVVLHDHDYL